MGIGAPRYDSLHIISLQKIFKLLGINPTILSAPRDNSLEIIDLEKIKIVKD